jgi:hypothetical protein
MNTTGKRKEQLAGRYCKREKPQKEESWCNVRLFQANSLKEGAV